MAAPTEWYVDPDIAGNSGVGTIGDPFGDCQYALNEVGTDPGRDAANGDRFNILTGTDELLGAALDFSTYGTPALTAPWICQGYTSAAGDGGIGGISGNGSVSVVTGATMDYLHFVDMHLHNTGSATIIDVNNGCSFFRCEVDNSTGSGLLFDDIGTVLFCHIHNIATYGIDNRASGYIAFNYFENNTNDFIIAVRLGTTGSVVENNVFDIDGASVGIRTNYGETSAIINNTIYASSGTGTGISNPTGMVVHVCINNYVEGFSGVGGMGIGGAGEFVVYGHNKFYNNTDDENITGDIWQNLGNNDALSSSALINAGGDDFTTDTTVKALAYPTGDFPNSINGTYCDIGALQRKEFPRIHPGYSGGLQ